MDDGIIFFVLLIIGGILLVPILTLIKVGSMKKNIDYLSIEIDNLKKKLTDIQYSTATKEDTQQILDILKDSSPFSYKDSASKDEDEVVIITIPSAEDADEVVPKETIVEKEIILDKEPIEIITLSDELPRVEMPKEATPPPFAACAINEKEEDIVFKVLPDKEKKAEPKSINYKNTIERILGDNILSKIGIITLVLGIAFFVKYAIDQEWINEIGRVGIGLLTGGIIIGVAHKLKSKYHVFSSILAGGGIAVLYITITLAFREYHLFNQTVAFVFLILITIFSVILSLLYDRKELAIFSLLGGFASPLMISTGAGNYIVLFSYILILNTGMLAVSFAKKWQIIGIISYVLTLIFFWTWLLSSFTQQYIGATLFAILFFAQFYSLALIQHFKSKKKITAFQAILILTNNLSLFLACLYIFDHYQYDVRGLITITIAAVNAVIMFTLFKRSEVDKNLIYLIIAVVMSFVSLAIPIQLNGYVITMFWAAETVLLIWLWQKSQIQVFRIGFLAVSVLTIISYIIDLDRNYAFDTSMTVVANPMFITGIVVFVSFLINLFLLRKEDKESSISIKGFNAIPLNNIINLFGFIIVVLGYIVPLFELNYQLKYTDIDYTSSFRDLVLATYTCLYIALLAFIYRKKLASNAWAFISFFAAIALYAILYSHKVVELRFDIFFTNTYKSTYFLIHFLSLPAVAYIIYLLIKNIRALSLSLFSSFCWAMVAIVVVILSVELDNIVILLFGNKDNYHNLLYDVHTFGYPILWGLIAMTLMIWGLNKKEVLLRKISLIFFGGIIVKFYAYDVWYMSQAGRIVSFVILGIILLLVSFLQQKIKTLVKEDEKIEDAVEPKQEKELF